MLLLKDQARIARALGQYVARFDSDRQVGPSEFLDAMERVYGVDGTAEVAESALNLAGLLHELSLVAQDRLDDRRKVAA